MLSLILLFFFNDAAPTEIYTLSLHDALPICRDGGPFGPARRSIVSPGRQALQHPGQPSDLAHLAADGSRVFVVRSEEHTSELQSRLHLVCRLLLEKKKKNKTTYTARHLSFAQ